MKNYEIKIEGMMCSQCAKSVEEAIKSTGVEEVSVNLLNNTAFVTCPNNISSKAIEEAIKKSGYSVKKKQKRIDYIFYEMIIGIIIAIPLLLAHLAHLHVFPASEILQNGYFQLALATIVQVGIGWRFYKRAFFEIKVRRLGMNVLVVLGTTAAYCLSIYGLIVSNHKAMFFECGALVLAIVNLGHFLQEKIKQKTNKALEELMKLQVQDANRVLENGEIQKVSIEELQINDIVEVAVHGVVPVDGEIVNGISYFDESYFTGESLPVEHQAGEKVIGGSINVGQLITVRISVSPNETILKKIIRNVEMAMLQKPPIQRLGDKLANIFVPVVFAIALISFFLNVFLLTNNNYEESIIRAVSVLVVSCPCALGLAVPMSVMVGYSSAASQGIIFKSGEVFERVNQVSAVCFDKTGTLTEGKFSVISQEGNAALLAILVSMEKSSIHPLAKSITEHYKDIPIIPNLRIENIVGWGLKTFYQNHLYSISASSAQEAMNKRISLFEDGIEVLSLELADQIKDSSAMAISNLQKLGIEVFVISGDKQEIVRDFGEELNIKPENIFGGVKPIEKAEIIKKIQSFGKIVAFVGDGVNDAVALKTADLGMAISSGSTVAIQTAEVTLLGNDMNNVAKTLKMTHRIYQNIMQNFFWAFIYNLAMIPLAVFGIINPIISAAFMALSNLFVVLNALRLRERRKK